MKTLENKTTLLTKIIDVGVLDPEDARRRRLLNILLLAMAIVASLMLVITLVIAPMGIAGHPQEVRGLLLAEGLTLLSAAALYGINRYVSGTLASAAFLQLVGNLAAQLRGQCRFGNGPGASVEVLFPLPLNSGNNLDGSRSACPGQPVEGTRPLCEEDGHE